ncbi:MAG: penicillin acylase family protein [Myxococcales bacterium]|nr:penicillin acylase family protein [Myxococcales bacterium]
MIEREGSEANIAMGSGSRGRRAGGLRLRAWALLALVTGLCAWGLAGLLELRREWAAHPLLEGRLVVPGLESPVSIDRDRQGIPHVSAESERDGWLGLGFVHAQDRLGQMLWLRALAEGRSSESLGAAGLDWDRLARALDFPGLAVSQYPFLRDDVREALEAYAAGVNARLGRIEAGRVGAPVSVQRAALPLEPWKPQDSLALLKLYAWGAGESLDTGLLLGDLIEHFGASRARSFLPGGRFTELPKLGENGNGRSPQRGSHRSPRQPKFPSLPGLAAGSSVWLVDGEHAEGGRPLLLAEVHAAPTAPALLHLDRLRAGSFDVAGATLPGLPVFWIGRNRQLAWAGLKAPVVTSDLYRETLDPSDAGRYHDARGWRGLVEREEVLGVRGGPDELFRVRATRHGPLLPAFLTDRPLSISWVGGRVGGPSGIASMFDVARAASAEEVAQALATHVEPALLVGYADSRGEAGLQMAGWLPDRSLSSHLMPLPGRVRWYDWKERVPYRALPSLRLGARRGWLVAGDENLDSLGADPRIEWLARDRRRGHRMQALLGQAVTAGSVDLHGLSRLQADVRDPLAVVSLRVALELVEGGEPPMSYEALELVAVLESWDGRASAESIGAAAYHVFSTTLAGRLLGEIMGEGLAARYRSVPGADPQALAHALIARANWQRESGSGTAWRGYAAAVRESLRESWLVLSYRLGSNRGRWSWGRLHVLRVKAFGGLAPLLANDVGLPFFPYSGNGDTVKAAAHAGDGEFGVTSASTLRFAADAGALDQGLAAIAPGQSEHPGHLNFGDGLVPWREGQSALLVSGGLLVESSSVHHLILEPET